jgi:sec-independent protein translocase protein TatA
MNLGVPELLVILLIVLLLFGSKKIPELARGLGRGIREFKDATKDPGPDEKKTDDAPKS